MRSYYDLSRTHSYSLLSAFPLLLLYELGAFWLAQGSSLGLRNGADVLLRTLFATLGVRGTPAFAALLLLAALGWIIRERRHQPVPLRGRVFAWMAAESVLYALLFGGVVGTATAWLLGDFGIRLAAQEGIAMLPLREGIVLSLGAGLYEELVFRVLVVGGLAVAFHAAGFARREAGVAAVLLGALLFSVFHYIGPYGEAWALSSFLFRFLAGVAFSALFLLRGFGITAWTHALYDIFLLLSRAA